MKNIYLIPSDSPSRLQKNLHGKLFLTQEDRSYSDCINQNIYITFYGGIMPSDYFLFSPFGDFNKGEIIVAKADDILEHDGRRKKIVLTTDKKLIKDGVQAINDVFLEWFINNQICEFVETVEIGHYKYEIILPINKAISKTSYEWQKQYPDIEVLDPDGWNRSNFQYSWFEEKITLDEYNKRLMLSTVKSNFIKIRITVGHNIQQQENEPLTIEQAAKQEIPVLKHIIYDVSGYRKVWIDGAKSEAAKNYWFSVFQDEHKNDDVVIKKQELPYNQTLYDYLYNELGVVALDTNMQEIERIVLAKADIKGQLDKMYSEEEVISLLSKLKFTKYNSLSVKKWFEKFKNK